LNSGCGGGCQAGPWYSYWPYEAHFQAPAPTGCYPYWGGAAYGAPVAGQAPATPAATPPATIKQSGFETISFGNEAPSYWYGR
jgi:hypothetical protein